MTEQQRLNYLNNELHTTYTDLVDVNWNEVSAYQKLSEDFIREFKDKVDWRYISMYQKLSEGFIGEYADRVSWYWVSMYQKLSEGFIREFKDRVNWGCISAYQHLSEDFIREFADMVDWYWVSMYQNLSEDFIREFKDRVSWDCISEYQKLSEDFIREFRDKLDKGAIEGNWCYKDREFLKQQVEDTGLYECHEDYFVAYKGIRSDRYSLYNFQYRYLPGEEYESHCDCTSNESSFGLSAWTEEKAKEYCNELVVKVRIRYEDVGRVVHGGGKIRCRKLTVLE